ncbi:hypothetical protein BDP55DRAFT_345560 [Colletotrichum godetiae]|uniref:Uncharacterized protein n=1 Tax=Colletotrichum godetiae TaxID=1209918 RepID=A0AAJ0AY98_9PEZI|nr:uncharacterized protein BDP55DRAFT_345560 [Colletotrichum godetiae]KAK1690334.1 hypothetical protein BDP55DRAFT_345560 [Colletotrichum godetiae]
MSYLQASALRSGQLVLSLSSSTTAFLITAMQQTGGYDGDCSIVPEHHPPCQTQLGVRLVTAGCAASNGEPFSHRLLGSKQAGTCGTVT